MTPTCVRCGHPTADQAYADQRCGIDRPTAHLAEIIDMTPAARDIATGQTNRSTGAGATGKPGSRLPFDLTATAKLDGVTTALTKWINHIGAVRGTTRPWFTHTGDPIIVAATWLTTHLEWMRHRPNVDEFLTDVEACARIVRGVARGPGEKRYLGPCGAPTQVDVTTFGQPPGSQLVDGPPCDGDVHARVHTDGRLADTGTCRTCHATVDTAERTAWLDGEARQHAYRAAQIAEAYGVNVNTIRTWSTRPRRDTGEPALASYWRNPAGLIRPWTDPTSDNPDAELAARGPRLHYVGDVLDLAAADAARREETRAKRARRDAARAAEEASDAA